MANEYSPVAFYFRLSFSGISGMADASFKEASGISLEMDAQEILERGNNNYKHKVPTSVKFSNLVLKRGMMPRNSEMAHWCMNTFDGGLSDSIKTKTISISLLNENGQPLKTWNFVNAWPVNWSASDLNSMNNEILIETLEFAYSYFESVKV